MKPTTYYHCLPKIGWILNIIKFSSNVHYTVEKRQQIASQIYFYNLKLLCIKYVKVILNAFLNAKKKCGYTIDRKVM